MDHKRACSLLELDNASKLTTDVIKRQFRIMALMFHPDKNPTGHSKFQEIREAHDYLLNHIGEDSKNIESYQTMFCNFLHYISTNPQISAFIDRIKQPIEDSIVQSLENMNLNTLLQIDCIIQRYNDVLKIDQTYITKMSEILERRRANLLCYVIEPSFDDIINGNVFKLNHCDDVYFVPLWHSHMTFADKFNNVFHVICKMPKHDYASIDYDNNIHISVMAEASMVLSTGKLIIKGVTENDIDVEPSRITLEREQKIVLKDKGGSKINIHEPLDASKKASIIIHFKFRESES